MFPYLRALVTTPTATLCSSIDPASLEFLDETGRVVDAFPC